MSTDERHGAPSASALYRLAHCPASWRLGKQAEADGVVPPVGADATAGTRIHAALETGDTSGLSAEELRIVDRCKADEAALIEEMWPGDQPLVRREERLVMTDGKERPYFSGKADVIYINGNEAAVLDYKTGRGAVEPAKDNDQLRGLAVIVAQTYGCNRVRVAIIQPLAGAPTVADYDEESLNAADKWLHGVLNCCLPDFRFNPTCGDWCQYCPARTTCPAMLTMATTWVGTAKIPEGREEGWAFRDRLRGRALDLPNGKLGALMDDVKLIEWHLEAVKSAVREKLKDGEEVPGWELGEKAGNRIITDVNEAALRVAPLLAGADGGAQAALMRACTLSASDLTREIHHASGKKSATRYNMSEKESAAALESVLGDVMERGMKRTLQRKDEVPEIETTETE